MDIFATMRALYPDWQHAKLTKAGYILQREQALPGIVEVAQVYKDALEDMAWQFAYRSDGNVNKPPVLFTGGLSALEHAFSILDWPDPKPCPTSSCDIKRCQKWPQAGVPFPNGDYLSLCSDHSAMQRIGDTGLINQKRPDRGYNATERRKRLERFGSKPA